LEIIATGFMIYNSHPCPWALPSELHGWLLAIKPRLIYTMNYLLHKLQLLHSILLSHNASRLCDISVSNSAKSTLRKIVRENHKGSHMCIDWVSMQHISDTLPH